MEIEKLKVRIPISLLDNRVQNAIRRIEKKYCHKNTLTTNETNVFEKINTKSPFEKIDIFEDLNHKSTNPNNIIGYPTTNNLYSSKIQSENGRMDNLKQYSIWAFEATE